jgi:phage baseplate assembly protein V
MFSAELFRKLEGIVEIGLIQEVDHTNKRLRVMYESDEEEELTAWLPWPAEVGRNFTRWRPLKKGIQVILLSESGDLANAVIAGFLYTEAENITAPSANPDLDIIQFNDGTIIQYDSNQHALSVSAVDRLDLSAKTMNLSAETLNITAGSLTITAAISDWLGDISHRLGHFISNNILFGSHTHKENGKGNNTNKPNAI